MALGSAVHVFIINTWFIYLNTIFIPSYKKQVTQMSNFTQFDMSFAGDYEPLVTIKIDLNTIMSPTI